MGYVTEWINSRFKIQKWFIWWNKKGLPVRHEQKFYPSPSKSEKNLIPPPCCKENSIPSIFLTTLASIKWPLPNLAPFDQAHNTMSCRPLRCYCLFMWQVIYYHRKYYIKIVRSKIYWTMIPAHMFKKHINTSNKFHN